MILFKRYQQRAGIFQDKVIRIPFNDDAANTRVLSGYTLLNLSVSTPIAQDWTLLARVDNVGDRQYELARTYVNPGRSFYAGVRWAPK